MELPSLDLRRWPDPSWLGRWRSLTPHCRHADCARARTLWRRWRSKTRGVLIQGAWYCQPECQERALIEALAQLRAGHRQDVPQCHRVPLGLLLLSRQQLTAEQLRAGLNAQRAAGSGRIGEWLQQLGFVNEEQVTAALARQWSCPLLRAPAAPSARSVPQIPVRLLEASCVFPIDYVEATATLHLACGEGIDYSLLYAIEQMLVCRTEPCLAPPSWLRASLQALLQRGGQREAVFDRVADDAEFARIVRSYAEKVAASAIRMVSCRQYTWVRLERPQRQVVNLLIAAPV